MRCCRKHPRLEQQNSNVESNLSSLEMLAAQTLKITGINGLTEDNKLETELEDEIRWEERRPPSEIIGRARQKCEKILHSKTMLLVIIILNIVDCLLVVGVLTLDFHQVTNQLVSLQDHVGDFMKKLRVNNEASLADLANVQEDNVTVLFDRLLASFIVWNVTGRSGPTLANECIPIQASYNASTATTGGTNTLTSLLSFVATVSQSPLKMQDLNHGHMDYQLTAHKLHFCSISILSFLLLETIIKIGSVGRRFLRKKMEMFDAAVVAISFTLDLVFIQGLTATNTRSFVVILSFLLPWRILRVLNSLVVALMHQNRFHLKVLYKQKRKITKQYQDATESIQVLEKQVKVLKNLCNERGIQDWEINAALAPTMKAGSQGGLRSLGTLVMKAAESFATLTVPTVNECPSPTTSVRSLGTARSLSLPCAASCNGDVVHHGAGNNGQVGKSLQVKKETPRTPKPSPSRYNPRPGGRNNDQAARIGQDGSAKTGRVPGASGDRASRNDGSAPKADDQADVVRFGDQSAKGSSIEDVAGDASHESGLEDEVQVEVVEACPQSGAVIDSIKGDNSMWQGGTDASDKEKEPVDVQNSSVPLEVPGFFLSSGDSLDMDVPTCVEGSVDDGDQTEVFTKL